jgi:hypothetical protein
VTIDPDVVRKDDIVLIRADILTEHAGLTAWVIDVFPEGVGLVPDGGPLRGVQFYEWYELAEHLPAVRT